VSRGVDILKEFSERHEKDLEPFEQWRERRLRMYEDEDSEKCGLCGHYLTPNNMHGFDQNDAVMDGEKFVHSGRCTYCRECNPGIFEVKK
jgi:hypothetical protein